MIITALIMAGGRGERFWPRSRRSLPKQFLSLTGDGKTMIQLTVERILPLVRMEDIYIATNKVYKPLVLEQLPGLPEQNILCEPVGRNTAPCIGMGAAFISRKYEEALMIVLPSDHQIAHRELYLDTLRAACDVAEKGRNLVTIGIQPAYPETGYGYIRFDPSSRMRQAYQVDCFVEKPQLETAKKYLAEGRYLWNSGQFIWKVSTILRNMERFMPDTYAGLMRIRDAIGTEEQEKVLEEEFTAFESQSIDYGIMEKAGDIYILPGTFGWDDVGSWLAVERLQMPNGEGNVESGNVVSVNTRGCIVQGQEKLLALVGLEDIVVVDTPDATLISSKEHVGEIKDLLARLKERRQERYL